MTTATNGSSNGAPTFSPEVSARLGEAVVNATTLRAQLLQRMLDQRRNLEQECDYPEGYVDPWFYKGLYDREAIATRVVEVWPKESWQVQPSVYEEEDADKVTAFEEAWDALGQSLRGEDSWYAEEEGSQIWEYLLRADILSGIGQYGVLLLGFDDGKDLGEPLKPRQGMKLVYLRAFPETLAPIGTFDNDVRSPRYGQPDSYQITFNDPSEGQASLGVGTMGTSPTSQFTTATRRVHWSRIIHLADNRSASEPFGIPRQRPVLNRILDARKVYSASAEGYWQSCFTGLSFETHPQLGGDVQVNTENIRDTTEAYINGLQRFLVGIGGNWKTLAPNVVDPSPHIDKHVEAICIVLGVPVRIFKGSERGELASSQDDQAWNDRVGARQRFYVTPRVIVPTVDRLIWAGVLPKPKQSYKIHWPDITSRNEQEKATTANTKTTAIATYVKGGVEALVTPMDYLTRFLDFTEEEAQAMIESAAQEQEKHLQDQQAVADEHGFEPVPPDGFKQPEPQPPVQPIKVKEGEQLVYPNGQQP